MGIDLNPSKIRMAAAPVDSGDGSIILDAVDFSSIDQYLRCGKQYWFRNVKGLKSPPGIAMIEGTSHHAAVEEDNLGKIKHGKSMTAEQLTEVFVKTLREKVPYAEKECDESGVEFSWGGETENIIVSRAKSFHVDYEKNHSHKVDPVLVEAPFTKEYEIDGIKFSLFGWSDLVTKEKVFDYKVSARAKTQNDLSESMQLSLYAGAFGKEEVGFINFIKSSKSVQFIEGKKSESQKNWSLKVVAQAVAAIRKGVFPLARPDSQSWWCSRRFCGYWNMCRGKHG